MIAPKIQIKMTTVRMGGSAIANPRSRMREGCDRFGDEELSGFDEFFGDDFFGIDTVGRCRNSNRAGSSSICPTHV